MTAVAAPAGFSIGSVISRLFAVLGRNFVTFLLLSVLLVGLPTAVISFIQLAAMSPLLNPPATSDAANAMMAEAFSPLRIGLGFAALLVTLAGNATLQGAVIHATVGDLSGRRVSFGESLATGFRFFLPLVGIGLIVGIGCVIGFIFFIVPGVLLALVWSVAAPAEVVERVGVFGALGRSLELTRNHRGAIFALGVVYLVAVWIVEILMQGVLGVGFASSAAAVAASPAHTTWGFQNLMLMQTVINLISNTLFASLSSAGIASIYFELRQTKEGVGVEQLAAVFD
jgi:hypothetical protein